MQPRLTRGLSSLYLGCGIDLSLDPVQNIDDLVVFYRSNPSYCVVFFAPRYHELARKSHISLQHVIHDTNSSVALYAFINQLSSIPSTTSLQCAFMHSLNGLLKRLHASTISSLAFRDDTYVPYRKSHTYPRQNNLLSSSPQRSMSPLLRKRYMSLGHLSTNSSPLTRSSRTTVGYSQPKSFDDSCVHMHLILLPRYTITNLKSFIQYSSKIVPRHNCSWEQIINSHSSITMTKHVTVLSSNIYKKSNTAVKQKTSNVRKYVPLSRPGFTLTSPYFPIKYSKNIYHRSGYTLLTHPPKTSRVSSTLDIPILTQQSQNKPTDSGTILLKDLDVLSINNDSPALMCNTEKFISTLNSTSLFDDQSLLTSSCEHAQKKLSSDPSSQNQEQSVHSQMIVAQDTNELQLTNYQDYSITSCSNENKESIPDPMTSDYAPTDQLSVLQNSKSIVIATNCPVQLGQRSPCHTTQSIHSFDQQYHTIPALAVNQHQRHKFPNDMDIYDLEVVSCSPEMTSIALTTPPKMVNSKVTKNTIVVQRPRVSRVCLDADQADIKERKDKNKSYKSNLYNTEAAGIINQPNINCSQKITTSPVPIEVSPNIALSDKKMEYAVIGNRFTYSSCQRVSNKAFLNNRTSTYAPIDNSSNNGSNTCVFDRQRLKMNAKHVQASRTTQSSTIQPLTTSQVKTEGMVCESLGGGGHTYLLNTLLLQQSKKRANNKHANSAGNTLLAFSSSRAETSWRPMTAVTVESRNTKSNNNLRSRTASQASPTKKMWCKHLGGPTVLNSSHTSKDKGHTRCKATLNLEISIV